MPDPERAPIVCSFFEAAATSLFTECSSSSQVSHCLFVRCESHGRGLTVWLNRHALRLKVPLRESAAGA